MSANLARPPATSHASDSRLAYLLTTGLIWRAFPSLTLMTPISASTSVAFGHSGLARGRVLNVDQAVGKPLAYGWLEHRDNRSHATVRTDGDDVTTSGPRSVMHGSCHIPRSLDKLQSPLDAPGSTSIDEQKGVHNEFRRI